MCRNNAIMRSIMRSWVRNLKPARPAPVAELDFLKVPDKKEVKLDVSVNVMLARCT